jgi:hypothetical protein
LFDDVFESAFAGVRSADAPSARDVLGEQI